jgi:hypothetical protein
VDRTPAGTGFGFAFERRVAGAHQGLPDVVEAVGGVVGDFLREIRAAVALLEVADEVGLLYVSGVGWWLRSVWGGLTRQCSWWNADNMYPGPSWVWFRETV